MRIKYNKIRAGKKLKERTKVIQEETEKTGRVSRKVWFRRTKKSISYFTDLSTIKYF